MENLQRRRNSKQRDIIRKYLSGRTDHPTADKLYSEIHEEYPSISLGTIYRNLICLTESGEIQALNVGDGSTHFDPNPKLHAHFYCTHCKRIFDLFSDRFQEVITDAVHEFEGRADECRISITGLCPDCMKD
ncbi:MAG: Fur family transcriptional regulator [Succinivibrio sp.]